MKHTLRTMLSIAMLFRAIALAMIGRPFALGIRVLFKLLR